MSLLELLAQAPAAHLDTAPIVIAVIGANAVIVAAVIGVLGRQPARTKRIESAVTNGNPESPLLYDRIVGIEEKVNKHTGCIQAMSERIKKLHEIVTKDNTDDT